MRDLAAEMPRSAANARVGLIVGYVGGSHIAPELKSAHAATLLAGAKADDGRGADVVLADMRDVPALVAWFAARARDNLLPPRGGARVPRDVLSSLRGRYWTRDDGADGACAAAAPGAPPRKQLRVVFSDDAVAGVGAA